ncbi:glycosyltransferase [Microbulbifer sp. GL-2]|uniref:glycosyltransferase n=1 Tax=Microbulbifer sp. GL-2 TaxID=2591606 RepID=UPI0011655C5F|nr:glycosyltransferase [Microbulbifer sp. GL-2]BBM04218.1 capsular polysaccharide biosynthesis protein CapM [Microbulbifer sp. GL-2]
MRIVQVWPELEPGDTGKAALDFVQELSRQGCEPIVISAGGALVARLELHGIKHIQLPVNKKPFLTTRLVRRLAKTIAGLQADIVHVQGRLAALLVWRAWRSMDETSRPGLVTHADCIQPPSRRDMGLISGERVIAASSGVAGQLQEHYGEKLAAPACVIPRGISAKEFDSSKPVSGQWHLRLLNSYPQLEGKNWWLFSGDLSLDGELGAFLKGLAHAADRREDIFGLVVGEQQEGDLRNVRELELQVQELGLEGRVLFLGARRDMRELYASSQLLFSLARPLDSCGKNAMAALAMGCPVVAYKDTCAGDVLTHCFSQGVIERGGADALSEVGLALTDRPLKAGLHSFFHEDLVKQTINLYRELRDAST